MSISREDAQGIFASRTQISSPGKYQVKVTNDVLTLAESGVVHKELKGGAMQVSIANFGAFTPYHRNQAKKLVQEGDFQGAANQQLSSSIRDVDYMPRKGEIVEITVGYVETKDGQQALLVTGCHPLPLSTGSKISAEDIFGDFDEAEDDRIPVKTEEEISAAAGSDQAFG